MPPIHYSRSAATSGPFKPGRGSVYYAQQQRSMGRIGMRVWLRRAAVIVCFAAAATTAAQTAAIADNYPSRPITIIVPASPGGVTDMLGRLLAQHFIADFNAQAVVENKPGANNQVAAEYVTHQPGDGYTLFIGPGEHVHRQPGALRPSALRSRKGLHADLRPRADRSRAHSQPGGAGQQRQGADRARQGKARPAQLRHLWRRLERPSQHGNAQGRDRRELRRRAL